MQGDTVARRSTGKTGTRKRTAASRPVESTKAMTDTPDPTAEDTGQGTSTAKIETPDPLAKSVEGESASPLAEGPAQMGEDTATETPDAQTPETAGTPPADLVPDAVADTDSAAEAADTPEESSIEASADSAPDTAAQAQPVHDTDDTDDTDVGGTDAGETPAPPAPEAETPSITPPAPAPVPEKRGGFLPMLLGGLVAGGIGYGTHFVQTTQQTGPDPLDDLRAEVADLRATVAQGPDLSGLEAQIAAIDTPEPADLSGIQAAIDDLRSRIAALPRPQTDALQAQIDALRAEPDVNLAPLQDRLAALEDAYAPVPEQVAALKAEMADLRALATEEVAQAQAAIDTARATVGIDRMRAALVTGAPFADAVAQMQQAGVQIPMVLVDAASSGVQTLESLQNGYTAAARAAVSASLQAAPAASSAEKLGNFLRAQIGAQSLAPRDGDDPDAITARAAVAVADGNLQAALDELAALPDAGRAAMADWLTAVETRLNAGAALDALQAEITTE